MHCTSLTIKHTGLDRVFHSWLDEMETETVDEVQLSIAMFLK